MKYLVRLVALTVLLLAGLFWLAEGWARRLVGLKSSDNCFTWAMRHFDYGRRDGLTFMKSESGWFPHVLLVRRDEGVVTIAEYVPKNRVDQSSPPAKFDGEVKRGRYVEEFMKSPLTVPDQTL